MTTKAEAHRKKRGWEAYKPGDAVKDAGVRVISEPIELGPEMRNTYYDVRYTCCCKTARLSHERIAERKRRGNTRCRSCGNKRTAAVRRLAREQAGLPAKEQPPASDYGVTPPAWRVPPYVETGPSIDCDKGAQPESGVDWWACFSPSRAAVLRAAHNTTHRVRPNAQQEAP